MKVSISKEEKYTIVKPNEEKLDSSVAPNFKSELITLNAEGVNNLILDLSDVKYIDSSGLSALLVGNRVYTENGGAFLVAHVNDHVMKLINISQLQTVFDILNTVEEAVDSVFMSEIEKDLRSGENEA